MGVSNSDVRIGQSPPQRPQNAAITAIHPAVPRLGTAAAPKDVQAPTRSAKPRLRLDDQSTLVLNLGDQLEKLEQLIERGDRGRAEAMTRRLAAGIQDVRLALVRVGDRQSPDAAALLARIGDAAARLMGHSPDLDPVLVELGAVPEVARPITAARLERLLSEGVQRSEQFMTAGRTDLAQCVDRRLGREANNPYYAVRAGLREVQSHLDAGRHDFAEHAAADLERRLEVLERSRVRVLKPIPADPAGASLELSAARQALAEQRDRIGRPTPEPVEHMSVAEAGHALTATVRTALAAESPSPYSAQLKSSLQDLRNELLDSSSMSTEDARYLAECVRWDTPRFVKDRLLPELQDLVRLTNGRPLGSLHAISNEARNPQAGYGGLDVGSLGQVRDLWHEVFHHVEYMMPEAFEMAWSFAKSRASHDEPRRLHQLSPDLGFPPDLTGYDGPFIHPYAGVVKPERRSTELVSTGGEHLSDAGAMSDLAVRDLQHLELVLGLVARCQN